MTTPCIFLDPSIFPVILGPRPTLSRKPRQNRTKIEEKLKIQTSEFYIRDNDALECYMDSTRLFTLLEICRLKHIKGFDNNLMFIYPLHIFFQDDVNLDTQNVGNKIRSTNDNPLVVDFSDKQVSQFSTNVCRCLSQKNDIRAFFAQHSYYD